MKTYLLKPGIRQSIAKAGETGVSVAFNAKEWLQEYPAGHPQLMVTSPAGIRTPVMVALEDDLITGQVPDELLVAPGLYTYVFTLTSGGTQVQSGQCGCVVLASELAQTWQERRNTPDWAERIFLAAEVIEAAMDGTLEARNVAADAAAEAKSSETVALGAAGTATTAAETATEVLESIPEDYSQLSADVVDLKRVALIENMQGGTVWHWGYVNANGSLVDEEEGASENASKYSDPIYGVSHIDFAVDITGKSEGSKSLRLYVQEYQADGTSIGRVNVMNQTGMTANAEYNASAEMGFIRVWYRTYGLTDILTMTGLNDVKAMADGIAENKADIAQLETGVAGAVAAAEGAVTELRGTVNTVHGIELIPVDNAGYIPDGDAVLIVDTEHPTASPNLMHAVVSCQPGDVFTLNGTGGAAARLWCFVDEAGNNLVHAAQNVTAANLEIVAPAGAAMLIINENRTNIGICYKGRYQGANDILQGNRGQDTAVQNLRRKVVTINTSAAPYRQKPDVLALAHGSDPHIDSRDKSFSRFMEWCRAHADNIDDILLTGDLVWANSTNSLDYFTRVSGHENVLLTLGNHDQTSADSTGDNAMSEADAYAKYIGPFIGNWGDTVTHPENRTWWYKDYTAAKIRLIGLNTNYRDRETASAEELALKAEQLTWLQGALSGAKTAGLSVVIAEHYPLTGTAVSCNFHMVDKNLTESAKPKVHADYVAAVDDFIDGGGEFICWLAGHGHADMVIKGGTNNRQLCFCVTCLSSAASINVAADTERVVGTKSEDAFNVIAFDTDAKTVKIVRIGADRDVYLRPRNAMTIRYDTQQVISES